MVSLVFVGILQLPHTVISNSEKLNHPNEQPSQLIKFESWANEPVNEVLDMNNCKKKIQFSPRSYFSNSSTGQLEQASTRQFTEPFLLLVYNSNTLLAGPARQAKNVRY